ncbi:homeobox protein Mohawk-like [Aplochiton taeniatus]
MENSAKYRRYGSRLAGVKVRHKRQVLQDMARPLKHWLYKHRDNPYPTKTEKVLLALGSHMTLVQVSNWFANARRRLKNTVRQPDLSWALRIKLYNKYIQGNAERLSVSSNDSNSDEGDCTLKTPASQSDPSHPGVILKQDKVFAKCVSTYSDDSLSPPPPKYKSSLLNRYLNDTLRHMMGTAATADDVAMSHRRRGRGHLESCSSNEGDEDVVSPSSSSEVETSFVYHMGQSCTVGPTATGQSCTVGPTVTGQSCTVGTTATGQSCTVGPTAVAQICLEGATGIVQSCTKPATTSCIIQKSSHISEIKTVMVALTSHV